MCGFIFIFICLCIHSFSGLQSSVFIDVYLFQHNFPPGQFPMVVGPVGIDPDEWFYRFVVVLDGSCPRDLGPGGQ